MDNTDIADVGTLFLKYIGDAISRAVEDSVTRAMANYQPVSVEAEAPKYYTREELKDILHSSYPTIHGLMNKGALPFIKVGKKTLFPAEKVDSLVASGELRKYRRTH